MNIGFAMLIDNYTVWQKYANNLFGSSWLL